MAHLQYLPTWFVKGNERRAAYFTVQARELRAEGFVEEGAKAQVRKPAERLPEVVNEVGAEPFDSTESLTEPIADEDDLDGMTKAELLDWALARGVEIKNSLAKYEILESCKLLK